jgi:macrolide-specific efflux system membrane fusion protein
VNKNRFGLGITILVLLLAGAGILWKWKSGPRVTYRESRVERGNIDLTILATGTVSPENRLEIKPPIAGRIEQVLVKEGQKVAKGQILAWMSSSERAAMLDAARSKGAEEVRKWEELYRPTPVLAPIPGMIILRNVESGQTFTNADAILVMSDRLTVKTQVDETDIAQIKLKQPAKITLDAYPGQSLDARVDQIAFDAKTVNNVTNYVVDVLPDSTPETMRSGMTANVTFVVDSRRGVAVVPAEAVQTKAGARTVLVKSPNGADPAEREIQVGLTDGKRIQVLSGLTEGETVLTPQLERKSANSGGTNPFMPKAPGGKSRSASGGAPHP